MLFTGTLNCGHLVNRSEKCLPLLQVEITPDAVLQQQTQASEDFWSRGVLTSLINKSTEYFLAGHHVCNYFLLNFFSPYEIQIRKFFRTKANHAFEKCLEKSEQIVHYSVTGHHHEPNIPTGRKKKSSGN